MKNILLIFSLFIVSSTWAQSNELNNIIPLNPNVRYGKLSNGMTYYIQKNTTPQKRCDLRLVVNAGSILENNSQQGLAHLVEHMAFNGTKNFKKSEIVDFLENTGVRFGADLNAYTSFDETVYMLELPSDSEKILLNGIQILEDWAHNVSFENSEIDKERGVVIEEWRLGQGAEERMRRIYYPVLYKDSRYATRLPIGQKEIIENAPYDTLRQFYKDWYRPDLQAIVIVGDIDVDAIEKIIKDKFSPLTNPQNERPRVRYDVPNQDELLVSVTKDKESTISRVTINYRLPEEKEKTVSDYRNNIIYNLYATMLQDRYQELQQSANPPFNFAFGGYSPSSNSKSDYTNVAICNPKNVQLALKTLLNENQRLKLFGFTSTELERAKKSLILNYENSYNERDKSESKDIIGEYVYHFLNETPAPGIEWEYAIVKKYIDGISLNELNVLPKKWISDGKNCVVIITGPDKEGIELPTEGEVKNIFNESISSKLEAYNDKTIATSLMTSVPNSGSITSYNTWKDLGIYSWTFSNGAKVYVKSTSFKNDEIQMSGFSFGGTSIYDDANFIDASVSSQIVDNSGLGDFDNISLQKFLSDKDASTTFSVSTNTENISGSSDKKDLETMMQLMYLSFTSPRKDNTAFESFKQKQLSFIQNRSNSPQAVFSDSINQTMSMYNMRAKALNEKNINNLNLDNIYRIYQERFSNAGEFTFTFIGSIDTNALKPLLLKYIASLPSNKKLESFQDRNIQTPKGTIQKTIYKGSDPKSSVNIQFTGKSEYTRANVIKSSALAQLMNIKLRETLREDMSGTYGVGCNITNSHFPKETFTTTVGFGCSPDNSDKLIEAAKNVIANVKLNGCNDEDLHKVKELLKKTRETQMQTNEFWLGYIQTCLVNNFNLADVNEYNKQVDSLTSDEMKVLASKYFNEDNVATFILMPTK